MTIKFTTNETYYPDSMFSLTKLIKIHYDNKTPLSKEIIEQLNLNEMTKITITFYDKELGSDRMAVEENLATNIMLRLPLKYYEDYININWLYYGKEYDPNFVSVALYSGALDTINKILELGNELVNTYDPEQIGAEQQQLIEDYNRYVLKPIINVQSYLSNLKHRSSKKHLNENNISYNDIFHQALSQFETLYNNNRQIKHYNMELNAKNWFNQYDRFNGSYRIEEEKEKIIHSVVCVKEAFPVFLDIFHQIEDKTVLINLTNLQLSFINGNTNAVDFIVEKLNLPNKEATLEEIFHCACIDLNENISNNYASHSQQINEQLKAAKILFTVGKKYIASYHETPLSYILDFYTIADQRTLPLLKNDFPHIKDENSLIGKFNLHDIIYAQTIFEKFLSTYSLELKNNRYSREYPNKEMHLFAILKDKFTTNDVIVTDKKIEIHNYIVEKFLQHINLSSRNKSNDLENISNLEKLKILFSQFVLESNLDNKKIKTIKNKI